MAALSKSTVVQEVFESIYDRLVANVKTVTLADSTTSTVQTYTSSFPDSEIDSKSDYPIIVVNSPDLSWTDFTFTKKQVEGTFSVDVFTTKAETADLFIDAIINSIETYRRTLRTYGMMSVNLESTNYDQFMRGKMKVHMKSCTFGFKYIFTKTTTY